MFFQQVEQIVPLYKTGGHRHNSHHSTQDKHYDQYCGNNFCSISEGYN